MAFEIMKIISFAVVGILTVFTSMKMVLDQGDSYMKYILQFAGMIFGATIIFYAEDIATWLTPLIAGLDTTLIYVVCLLFLVVYYVLTSLVSSKQ